MNLYSDPKVYSFIVKNNVNRLYTIRKKIHTTFIIQKKYSRDTSSMRIIGVKCLPLVRARPSAFVLSPRFQSVKPRSQILGLMTDNISQRGILFELPFPPCSRPLRLGELSLWFLFIDSDHLFGLRILNSSSDPFSHLSVRPESLSKWVIGSQRPSRDDNLKPTGERVSMICRLDDHLI